jgi:hypothetical protein
MKKVIILLPFIALTGCLESETSTGSGAAGNLANGLTLNEGTFEPTASPTPTPSPSPSPTPTTPTFDGVEFSAEEEQTALEISNEASEAQLTAGGVPSSTRSTILSNRPYTNLSSLSETTGIGRSTMQAIKDMIATWTGPEVPPTP